MCIVKTPKVSTTSTESKPLPVLTNSLLDGYDPSGNLKIGPQSLRIDRVGSAASAPTSAPAVPASLAIPRPLSGNPTAPAAPRSGIADLMAQRDRIGLNFWKP